jgi:hypothetical protein
MKPNNKEAHARLMVLKYVVAHSIANPPRPMLDKLFAKWSENDRRDYERECKAHTESHIAAMRELGIWKYASPDEKAFLQSSGFGMDEYTQIAASWRMECIAMIMWALDLINEWPKIDRQTSHDLLKKIPFQKIDILSKHPRLRPEKDISHKRDLIELWHWRARTRKLIEEGYPFKPDQSMKKAGFKTFDDIVRSSARAAHEQGDLPRIIDDDFVFLGKPFRSLSVDNYQMATSIIMERHYTLNWLCRMAPGNRWDETPTDT